MNYLNLLQSASAIAGVAFVFIGSRWLKNHLWTLVRSHPECKNCV